MKVTYCGCKAVMKTQKTNFPRGKTVEVTDAVGNEILKVVGFYSTMTAEAKKELEANIKHEEFEIEKLKSGVKIVEVKVDNNGELQAMNLELEEAKVELEILKAEKEDLQKELLAEQAKSVKVK